MESLSAAAPGASASTAQALMSEPLDRQAFLKLLVAQLEHQDPLNPLNNEGLVLQLAQLSAVEQSQRTSSALEQLVDVSRLTNAASLAGRTVVFEAADGSEQAGTVSQVLITTGKIDLKIGDRTVPWTSVRAVLPDSQTPNPQQEEVP